MNGSISIVTNVVANIVDRLDRVAADLSDMPAIAGETFAGADAVQTGFDAMVVDLLALHHDLTSEVESLRTGAVEIGDAFFELDRRISTAFDGPGLIGAP